MWLKDVLEAVDSRWGKGYEYQADQQKSHITRLVQDFGEGFAVFVGGRLGAFTGDAGSARHSARMMVADGADKDAVRIKRVIVPSSKV